jgi:hypothetical protein
LLLCPHGCPTVPLWEATQLHEVGFNSDWIERALAHEQKGVRGVYNKAKYLAQCREPIPLGHGDSICAASSFTYLP